jgi:hypothetical protein
LFLPFPVLCSSLFYIILSFSFFHSHFFFPFFLFSLFISSFYLSPFYLKYPPFVELAEKRLWIALLPPIEEMLTSICPSSAHITTFRIFQVLKIIPQGTTHGILNYIDTKTKCRHLKKLTCKGTLLQVFIRVNRLKIQSVFAGIFDPAL